MDYSVQETEGRADIERLLKDIKASLTMITAKLNALENKVESLQVKDKN